MRRFAIACILAAASLMFATRLLGSFVGTSYVLPPVADWTITRNAGNPVITIPAGETDEQYVPAPIRLGNGDIWVYVKGDDSIYSWKSTDDGVTFTIQNGGAPVLEPVGGTWELGFVVEPHAIYDEVNNTIHLWYKGRDANPNNWSWGHATAPGGTPTVFTRDPANPIFFTGDAETDLGGGSITDFAISSVIKIGSTFHFYGYVQYDSVYYLCQATGTTWNDPGSLSTIARFDSSEVFTTPSVIKPAASGEWLMLYTKGDASHAGTRSIFTARSINGTTWTSAAGTVLAPTGSGWEQDWAYSGQFLRSTYSPFSAPYVDASGRWLFYYSGDSASDIDQAGLAYITP